MRRALFVLGTALTLAGLTRPAAAEPLRCGSVVIDVGAQAAYVLAKCGEPASKTTVTEPVQARGVKGGVYQTGTTQAEIWRYKFASLQHPVILKIADGVVQSIDTEESPGSAPAD